MAQRVFFFIRALAHAPFGYGKHRHARRYEVNIDYLVPILKGYGPYAGSRPAHGPYVAFVEAQALAFPRAYEQIIIAL